MVVAFFGVLGSRRLQLSDDLSRLQDLRHEADIRGRITLPDDERVVDSSAVEEAIASVRAVAAADA